MDKNVCYAYQKDGQWVLEFKDYGLLVEERDMPKKCFKLFSNIKSYKGCVYYKRNTKFKVSNLYLPKELLTLLMLNNFILATRERGP